MSVVVWIAGEVDLTAVTCSGAAVQQTAGSAVGKGGVGGEAGDGGGGDGGPDDMPMESRFPARSLSFCSSQDVGG